MYHKTQPSQTNQIHLRDNNPIKLTESFGMFADVVFVDFYRYLQVCLSVLSVINFPFKF